MAGNYPDVPGPRMAYHLDGTIGFTTEDVNWGSPPSQYSSAQMLSWNNEATTSSLGQLQNGAQRGYGVIFPQLRDLSGIMIAAEHRSANLRALQWSADSTNGIDGIWTTVFGNHPAVTPPSKVAYREQITALDLTGVKALRWAASVGSGGIPLYRPAALHLYGRISAGQTVDRLRLWHPTLDEEVDGAYFDWGDVARGSSGTRTFRVKNNSSTLTAVGITVGAEHPTDADPSLTDQIRLSTASSPTVEGQKDLGDLEPGEISELVTLHRDIDPEAQLSLWWSLISAEATSWSEE